MLMAFLTAVYGDFSFADIKAHLDAIFAEQYQLTFTPSVEIRSRLEDRTKYWTCPDTGATYSYTYQVMVEYEHHILTVTLASKPFFEVISSRMDEEQLRWDLEHAASVRLLKADHAAFIASFLHQQFKRAQRVSIPLSELIEQLEGYLESLNEREPGRYGRTAQEYLTQWADQQHRFIRIVADGPSVELTSDAERAIGWLEDLHPQSFDLDNEPEPVLHFLYTAMNCNG